MKKEGKRETPAEKMGLEKKDIDLRINATVIDSNEYLTTSEFAALAGVSVKTVNHYILYGNKARKLKSISKWGIRFIPVSELKDYPITGSGRYGWRNQKTVEGGSVGPLPGIDEVEV